MNNSGALQAPEDELCSLPWPNFWGPKICPGFMNDFVLLATDNSEADPAAVFITALIRFCSEIYGFAPGKGPYIYVGETIHPPRLFGLICGNSSKSRKGTSGHPVARLFDRKDSAASGIPKSLIPPTRESGGPLSTGEGLAFYLSDMPDEKSLEDEQPRYESSFNNKDDRRLFITDQEFASALACMKRSGNTLSMAIRCFWDDGCFAPITKTSPVAVSGAHVNILGHITVPELMANFDAVQAVNGFANRFLWVCARRTKLVPLPSRIPDASLAPIQRELWQAVAFAQKCGEVRMTKNAKELWATVYPVLSQDYPGIAGSIISRGEAQTIRLALVYSLIDMKQQIDEPHLEAALSMWSYARDSALYIFHHWLNNDPLDQKILNALGKNPLSATELSAALGRNIPKSQLEPALRRLEAQHHIEIEKVYDGASRPRILISRTQLP